MSRVAERIRFAVEVLQARVGDRVAEIGCGTGHAVSLIMRSSGIFLYAIDRSTHAIAKATRLNEAHVTAGRVRFETRNFTGSSPEQFDRLYAINVNLFWLQPNVAFPQLNEWLKPEASALLVFEAPTASRTTEIVEILSTRGASAPLASTKIQFRNESLVAMTFTKAR